MARKSLNRENRKSRDCLITIFTRNSTNGAQPISPKLLKGLGCCPTGFCTNGYRRALLANSIYGVSKQTGFCKNRRVYIHLLCLLFCKFQQVAGTAIFSSVAPLDLLAIRPFHNSKRHFQNGNRRQTPPCLPKSETDGRCQWRRSRSSRPLTASVCFATQIMILNEAKEA